MADKKQKWEVLTSDFVGAVIAFEGLAVAKMQGENQLKTANEIVSLLNDTEFIKSQRDQAFAELKDIRNYLKADENESTFDEVVRRIENGIKAENLASDAALTFGEENAKLRTENAKLKDKIATIKKLIRDEMEALKTDINKIIKETFS